MNNLKIKATKNRRRVYFTTKKRKIEKEVLSQKKNKESSLSF